MRQHYKQVSCCEGAAEVADPVFYGSCAGQVLSS
jgi:hypothetical protein